MNIAASQKRELDGSLLLPQEDRGCEPVAEQRVRVVEDFTELSDRDRLAWNSIVSQQNVTVPFQSIYWNETWWKHFGASSRWGEKKLQIFIVDCVGETIAFFPMLRQTFSLGGLQLLRYVQPLGSDNNLTELRSGIVRKGFEHAAYAALTDHLEGADRDWDVASLPAGPQEVRDLYKAISVEHPTIPLIEGFCIPLAADWDSFRSGLKRNIKESIRKCYNSFKRNGIDPEFYCLSEPDALREALPEFYRLHSLRSEQEGGNDHRDVFQVVHARRYLELLASEASESGLRLFLLKDGDRLIAARLGFETETGIYLYYSGYDLEYGKYSVMTRLVIEVIKQAISSGKASVHLSFGRDVSKTRWSPEETHYRWNLMYRKSLRGSAAALAFASLMRLKRRGYRPGKGSLRREDKGAAEMKTSSVAASIRQD